MGFVPERTLCVMTISTVRAEEEDGGPVVDRVEVARNGSGAVAD